MLRLVQPNWRMETERSDWQDLHVVKRNRIQPRVREMLNRLIKQAPRSMQRGSRVDNMQRSGRSAGTSQEEIEITRPQKTQATTTMICTRS